MNCWDGFLQASKAGFGALVTLLAAIVAVWFGIHPANFARRLASLAVGGEGGLGHVYAGDSGQDDAGQVLMGSGPLPAGCPDVPAGRGRDQQLLGGRCHPAGQRPGGGPSGRRIQ